MFNYKGRVKKVIEATTQANDMAFNQLFYTDLRSLQRFTHTEDSNHEIINMIANYKMNDVKVVVYKPWWRFSKAVAYFSKKKPNTINLNYYQMRKMSSYQITGTIWHEVTHLIDNKHKDHRFGHGNNSRLGKEKSAPYAIGRAAKIFAMRVFGV